METMDSEGKQNVKHVRKTRMFCITKHGWGGGGGDARTALDKQGFCLCNERFEKKKKKHTHGMLNTTREMPQRANKDMPSEEMKDLAMQSTAPPQSLSDDRPGWRGHRAHHFPAGSAVRGGERVGLAVAQSQGSVSLCMRVCSPFGAAALLLWSLPQTRQHCTVLHWP